MGNKHVIIGALLVMDHLHLQPPGLTERMASANPTAKRGTPLPSPGHVTGPATTPDDRTVTLATTPPESPAEHVSCVCLFFISGVR